MQRKFVAVLAGMAIVAVSATACSNDDTNGESASTPTPTPTATASEAAVEATDTPSATETPDGQSETAATSEGAGGVLAAIVLIDGAGFHGMDEALNADAPAIEASWLGATTRALTAARAIAWPGDVQPAADAFIDAAADLEAALEADDVEAAASAAAAAHETQHDLSHDVYHALGEMDGADDSAGGMLAALTLIDGAGYHGMDDALNGDAPAIETSWLGASERARTAAQVVAWPADLRPAADAFIEAALALEEALEADDVETAAPAAVIAHETQHALSHDAYDALGGMAASDNSPGGMLAAIQLIDDAGFHGIDDALNGDAPEINAGWVGATQRARVAAQVVDWGDVQFAADAFIEAALALEEALEADDLEAAAPAATAAHETQHDLSHDAYAALGGGGGSH